MTEIWDFHTKSLDDMPVDLRDRAVQALRMVLSDEVIQEILFAYQDDPVTWWASNHFTWGMSVRNYLRDNVGTDDALPSKNWDDYYVPLIEVVCGIRH